LIELNPKQLWISIEKNLKRHCEYRLNQKRSTTPSINRIKGKQDVTGAICTGDAEGILSRAAVDPGVGIRRPVRILRHRWHGIERPAAAATAAATAATAAAATATSGLQTRPGILVCRSRRLLAMHPMRPGIHPEPVRGAQGCDLRPALGAGARLVFPDVEKETGD